MMNNISNEIVINSIYQVRNQKVMFDFDLSDLYRVETRALKQAVKRNMLRFPDDFMFVLNKDEWQQVITNCDNLPERIKFSPVPPMAFSELGVAMLSSVLKSETAIAVNIQIMRVFHSVTRFLLDNAELRLEIEQLKKGLAKTDKNLDRVFLYLDELIDNREKKSPRTRIGFKPD